MDIVRVTFGMIVLNGEPFIRANLRAIYPYAHQIIIVEGASPYAAEFSNSTGHSLDRTLEIVREFAATEDPHGKIVLVTAEDEGNPNGFWPREKTQQSQAYARRATGDWLWQIDVDEFYHPEDMSRIFEYLAENGNVTCMTFGAFHFFGGVRYVVEGGFMWHPHYQGECFGRYRRIFRWRPGWLYASHRPPTIFDESGNDVTRLNVVDCRRVLGRSHVMYHYFMLSPEVILRKARYYSRISPKVFERRELACFELLRTISISKCLRIFDQFGTWNWLEPFRGTHPPEILRLIIEGRLDDGGLSDGLGTVVKRPLYRLFTRVLNIIERIRSLASSVGFATKRFCIGRAVFFPSWLWRAIPARWHKYRRPESCLEPWCAEIVADQRLLAVIKRTSAHCRTPRLL